MDPKKTRNGEILALAVAFVGGDPLPWPPRAFDEAVAAREATLNKSEGESLSIEDLSEVYIQVRGDQRARNNMSLNTRTKIRGPSKKP